MASCPSTQNSCIYSSRDSIALSSSNLKTENQDYFRFNFDDINCEDLIYFRIITIFQKQIFKENVFDDNVNVSFNSDDGRNVLAERPHQVFELINDKHTSQKTKWIKINDEN
jgi:hypothetical protein